MTVTLYLTERFVHPASDVVKCDSSQCLALRQFVRSQQLAKHVSFKYIDNNHIYLTKGFGSNEPVLARFTNSPYTHSAAFFFSLGCRSYRTVFSPVFVGILLTSYLPSSCETFLSPRAPSWLQSLSIVLTSIHRQNFCYSS